MDSKVVKAHLNDASRMPPEVSEQFRNEDTRGKVPKHGLLRSEILGLLFYVAMLVVIAIVIAPKLAPLVHRAAVEMFAHAGE